MINSCFFCLSTVLLYIGFISTEYVPVPDNVRVSSIDLGLQLTWDPPKNITDKLFKYTAELRGWSDFFAVCINSSSLSCDFTENVTIFGTYRLRVRAELNGETSEWVETEEFPLEGITEISAPHVELRSRKGEIEVDITDPPMRKKQLRDVFNKISYLTHYWKEGEVTKKEKTPEQNRFMLSDLDPQVNYCVQVAVLFLNNKSSHASNVTCIYNTSSDEVEQWFIAVVMLVSFGVVLIGLVLIFLAGWYSYKVCRMMFPDTKLPEHLKQYLSERPQSSSSVLLIIPPKEKVYEVSILHEESQSTQTTNEPIRVLEKQEDCWMRAGTKQRDENEEQRLLDEMTV